MNLNFDDIEFLNNSSDIFDSINDSPSFSPFLEIAIDFLDILSKKLLKNPESRLYPDLITFSFYCRKANILKLKNNNKSNLLRCGRGIVFHIAPSNIALNFAYSLVSGLLSGNTNIVKVPSKNFKQTEIICRTLNDISKINSFDVISSKIVLLKYSRNNNNITSYLSSICDVRIIWGGDETINRIRENKIPPRSFDITFADRYSICIINSESYLKEKNKNGIARNFYNDTFLFDQNACSSPHLIVWLGKDKNIIKSKNVFWKLLYNIVKEEYSLESVSSIDKLTNFYSQSVDFNNVTLIPSEDNLIWRSKIKSLNNNIEDYRCNSGYFTEYDAKNINELSKIINRKYQTLSYYGISKTNLIKFINQINPSGIDRIVPIGKTSDFSFVWDGYNLVSTLSRIIDII